MSWARSQGERRSRMKSRQVSARSKAGRRADRSCAAVGQAGQTTTAAPSSEATANRRSRARIPLPSWTAGSVSAAREGAVDEIIVSPKSYTLYQPARRRQVRRQHHGDHVTLPTRADIDPVAPPTGATPTRKGADRIGAV